ncbi:MAG: M4 family metallopeptidase [Saprospiraceae bacterium]|nr:M4 family metallopeptidase [Saprospiraceae bacterium]
MKSHCLFFALALQFFFSLAAFGQNKQVAKAYLVQQFGTYKNADPSLSHANFFERMADKMQLDQGSEMVLFETNEGSNGYTHYKYKQLHNGLPVFGNTYILHEKNGVVVLANGHFSPRAGLPEKPGIDADAALAFAKQEMNALRYAEVQAKPVLCYVDPAFPKVSETLRLAYQVDLSSTEPFDKKRWFVDAKTGKTLCHFPLILQEGVPSTAVTKYYGTRQIITDSLGPQQFELHDPTRGEGISVFNIGGDIFTNNSSNWDLTNPAQDEVALDAHYCSQEYFDMMAESFDWEGLDGNGKALKAKVHNNGAGPVNAFWDGEFTNYGDGNCNYGPLTTLEVVGHEYTHGMIDHTSKLIYSSESGAINESLADMFGKALERASDPANFDWDLGHSFLLGPDAEPFRVMDDPKSKEMPALYKGEFWFDFAGVHTNSSIGNLWFSMMVDGKQGTNEAGVDYNVTAIGMDKAIQIVFNVNRNYFTESSNYPAFYTLSMQVAEELYGAGSTEQLAVQEAWKAVGLPGNTTALLDLSIGAAYVVEGVCGLGELHTVRFSVINSGSFPYEPAMGATVVLSEFDSALPDLTYPITQALLPGEVLEVVIDDWFEASSAGTYFVNLDLEFEDDAPDNNYGWVAFDLVEFEANDMGLRVFFGKPACFAEAVRTSIYLDNKSCETIAAGTSMLLRAENLSGDLLWTMPINLDEDLEGFGTDVLVDSVAVSSFEGNGTIRFELEYGNDPNSANNESMSEVGFSEVINGIYSNNFNNANNLIDGVLDIQDYFSEPLVNYQGETFYASTGLFDNPDFFEHCPDFESNFNNDFFGGITATMRACVDYSAHVANSFSFDFAMFKNSFAEAEGYPYSSMVQAKWTGNESGSTILTENTEGAVGTFSHSIPFNFKGELLFKIYAEIGQWEIDPANFENDDFVLMDNLYIGYVLNTDGPQPNPSITVSPNPTQGSVNIQSSGAMQTLRLLDVSGRVVEQRQVSTDRAELDLGKFKAGFYFLNVELENGQWAVQKLVKI